MEIKSFRLLQISPTALGRGFEKLCRLKNQVNFFSVLFRGLHKIV